MIHITLLDKNHHPVHEFDMKEEEVKDVWYFRYNERYFKFDGSMCSMVRATFVEAESPSRSLNSHIVTKNL